MILNLFLPIYPLAIYSIFFPESVTDSMLETLVSTFDHVGVVFYDKEDPSAKVIFYVVHIIYSISTQQLTRHFGSNRHTDGHPVTFM